MRETQFTPTAKSEKAHYYVKLYAVKKYCGTLNVNTKTERLYVVVAKLLGQIRCYGGVVWAFTSC